jgi:hypothetical protein
MKLFRSTLILYFLALNFSCSTINKPISRAPSSVESDLSCKKIASNIIEQHQVNEEIANISGIRYLTQKFSEIKHLDTSNLYAMQLRAILVTGNKGKTVETLPLSKLKAIHPIDRGASLEKTLARAAKIKSYVEANGVPKVFNTDIQEETIKSRLLMRAVKTDENDYIIFDGNGRLFALREYFEKHELKDMPIEVEVYDVDYKRIKHLIEIRRKHLYETGEDVSKVRSILYHKHITEEELDISIAEFYAMAKRYNKMAKVAKDKKHAVEFANLRSELSSTARELENIKLWRRDGYSKAYKQGITEAQIDDMVLKKVPLGFTKQDFDAAKLDLLHALKSENIDGGHVLIDGSSTTFYSNNPSKKLGHHFKNSGINKSDYDFKIFSSGFADVMRDRGYKWSKHEGHYKGRWVEKEFPAIKEFNRKWSMRLKRKVTVIGVDSDLANPEAHGDFVLDLTKK